MKLKTYLALICETRCIPLPAFWNCVLVSVFVERWHPRMKTFHFVRTVQWLVASTCYTIRSFLNVTCFFCLNDSPFFKLVVPITWWSVQLLVTLARVTDDKFSKACQLILGGKTDTHMVKRKIHHSFVSYLQWSREKNDFFQNTHRGCRESIRMFKWS